MFLTIALARHTYHLLWGRCHLWLVISHHPFRRVNILPSFHLIGILIHHHIKRAWEEDTKGINSLTAIGGHDRPYFYKLRARVVSLRIFVRYQRLMARKIAELFGLNRGVRPFCAARCFNELSRGSVLCLLNASFKTAVSQRHNSIFYTKIDDHGIRWGNTGQILAQRQRSVASRVALDLLYWVMCLALYRLTRMAFEMARKAGACFSFLDFMSCITICHS